MIGICMISKKDILKAKKYLQEIPCNYLDINNLVKDILT